MNTVILRDKDQMHDYTAVPIGTPVEGYRTTVVCPRCGQGAIVLVENYDVVMGGDSPKIGRNVHMELAHRREKRGTGRDRGWVSWPKDRCEWTAEAAS